MYRVHWLHCLNSWINIGNMTPNSWNTSNSHAGQSLDIPQHLLMVTVLADCHIFAGWALKRISGPKIVMTRSHIAQTLLWSYFITISMCLIVFLNFTVKIPGARIKRSSPFLPAMDAGGSLDCKIAVSTQFEGELSTHRDWNWWQLLSDSVTQRTNGACFIETISRINTKQAFPHVIWSVISWAELLENKWTWELWWTCSSYKPFAAPSEEYQNIRDCTSCSFQKCSHCFLNITLYFCLLSFARSTVHVSRTSLQKCNTQTDPQVCIGCSFLICKHGQK